MARFNRIAIPLDSAQDLMKFVIRALRDLVENLGFIFDKGVGVTDNLDVDIIDITTNGVINTEDAFAHTLGRIPTGYIVAKSDKGAVIYSGGTTNTKTAIYLRSNVATVAAKIIVF